MTKRGQAGMGYRMADKENRKRRLLAELDGIVGILRDRGVEKVILFGSLASGNIGSTSDIDLIVVEQTGKRFLERLDDIYSLLQLRVGVDVLVYTPGEIEQLRERGGFVRRALEEGMVLYEKER